MENDNSFQHNNLSSPPKPDVSDKSENNAESVHYPDSKPTRPVRVMTKRNTENRKPNVGSDFQVDKNQIPSPRPLQVAQPSKVKQEDSEEKIDQMNFEAERVQRQSGDERKAEVDHKMKDWDEKTKSPDGREKETKKRKNSPATENDSEKSKKAGVLLWSCDELDEKTVDSFLGKVEKLFPLRHFETKQRNEKVVYRDGYSLEKTLYFLKKCDYNTSMAFALVDLDPSLQKSDTIKEGSQEKTKEVVEDFCFSCMDGGNLLLCDYEGCRRVFHARCANLEKVPEGEWNCPTHLCCVCGEKSNINLSCSYCPNSYCEKDLPEGLHETALEFLCKPCADQNLNPKQRFLTRFNELLRIRHETVRTYRVGGVDIDLFDFYSAVVQFGGARRVTDSMRWSKVRAALTIPESSTNASSLLKSIYAKTLYPYEKLFYQKSLPLEIENRVKRGRPTTKSIKPSEIGLNETCDIVVTEVGDRFLKIEANANGVIKKGFLFLPQIKDGKRMPREKENSQAEATSAQQTTPLQKGEEDSNVSLESKIVGMVSDVSSNVLLNNPDFDIALEAKFALKKFSMSLQSLAKTLNLDKEELNLLFNANEQKRCPEYVLSLVVGWLERLTPAMKECVRLAVENYKFKEMVKLENIKVETKFAQDKEQLALKPGKKFRSK